MKEINCAKETANNNIMKYLNNIIVPTKDVKANKANYYFNCFKANYDEVADELLELYNNNYYIAGEAQLQLLNYFTALYLADAGDEVKTKANNYYNIKFKAKAKYNNISFIKAKIIEIAKANNKKLMKANYDKAEADEINEIVKAAKATKAEIEANDKANNNEAKANKKATKATKANKKATKKRSAKSSRPTKKAAETNKANKAKANNKVKKANNIEEIKTKKANEIKLILANNKANIKAATEAAKVTEIKLIEAKANKANEAEIMAEAKAVNLAGVVNISLYKQLNSWDYEWLYYSAVVNNYIIKLAYFTNINYNNNELKQLIQWLNFNKAEAVKKLERFVRAEAYYEAKDAARAAYNKVVEANNLNNIITKYNGAKAKADEIKANIQLKAESVEAGVLYNNDEINNYNEAETKAAEIKKALNQLQLNYIAEAGTNEANETNINNQLNNKINQLEERLAEAKAKLAEADIERNQLNNKLAEAEAKANNAEAKYKELQLKFIKLNNNNELINIQLNSALNNYEEAKAEAKAAKAAAVEAEVKANEAAETKAAEIINNYIIEAEANNSKLLYQLEEKYKAEINQLNNKINQLIKANENKFISWLKAKYSNYKANKLAKAEAKAAEIKAAKLAEAKAEIDEALINLKIAEDVVAAAKAKFNQLNGGAANVNNIN